MAIFSWFDSPDHVDAALIWVAVIGAIVEAAVAVTAVINVHKELEESRKKKLEKYIEIFACVAAFFFLAEAILGWRSSLLLGMEIEHLRTSNLELERQIQPRRISREQKIKALATLGAIPGKTCQVRIVYNDPDLEAHSFALDLQTVFEMCHFPSVKIESQFVTFPNPYDVVQGLTVEKPSTALPESEMAIAFLKEVGALPTNALIGTSSETNLLNISVWTKPLN